jgi:hypothetical protein
MFEPLYSRQAEPGANGEAVLPVAGATTGTGEASGGYGDVPLGVEAAWPAGAERAS